VPNGLNRTKVNTGPKPDLILYPTRVLAIKLPVV